MISSYKRQMREQHEAPQEEKNGMTLFNYGLRRIMAFSDGFEYTVGFFNDFSTKEHIGTGDIVYVDEDDNFYYSYEELERAILNGNFKYSQRFPARVETKKPQKEENDFNFLSNYTF